jgi:hypothetical protein
MRVLSSIVNVPQLLFLGSDDSNVLSRRQRHWLARVLQQPPKFRRGRRKRRGSVITPARGSRCGRRRRRQRTQRRRLRFAAGVFSCALDVRVFCRLTILQRITTTTTTAVAAATIVVRRDTIVGIIRVVGSASIITTTQLRNSQRGYQRMSEWASEWTKRRLQQGNELKECVSERMGD